MSSRRSLISDSLPWLLCALVVVSGIWTLSLLAILGFGP